jgi:hypothetical protein
MTWECATRRRLARAGSLTVCGESVEMLTRVICRVKGKIFVNMRILRRNADTVDNWHFAKVGIFFLGEKICKFAKNIFLS